jgi:hypothetical protein
MPSVKRSIISVTGLFAMKARKSAVKVEDFGIRFQVRNLAGHGPELHAVDRSAACGEVEPRAAKLEFTFDVVDPRPAVGIVERPAGHFRCDLENAALVVRERKILELALDPETHVARLARDYRAFEPTAHSHELVYRKVFRYRTRARS